MPLSELTKERAREMRKAPTSEEKTMWNRLRDGRMLGHKFRRQHPVEPYIPDFACVELMLIIELDGAGHPDQAAYDARRDEYLRDRDWTVLRFGNDDVVLRLHAVLEAIVHATDKIASPSP